MSQSQADLVSESKLFVTNTRKPENSERMTSRGFTEEKVASIESHYTSIEKLDSVQEAQKAATKMTTEEIQVHKKQLKKELSEGYKTVKLEYPQSQWVEFGIHSKR